jgi:Protein of unknown function (DUF2934)
MAQNDSRNLCIRREPPCVGDVIMTTKSPGTAEAIAVARPGSVEEIEMEGNKTTARRSRRGGSARAAVAEPARAPVKARAKAPAKASTKVKVTKPKPAVRTDVETSLTESDRLRMIELAAFFRAERRGFVPGFEAEDWFSAEAEIAAQVPAASAAKPARKARKPAS